MKANGTISEVGKFIITQNCAKIQIWFRSPKKFKDTQRLDKKNSNTKWVDPNTLEHEQLIKICYVQRPRLVYWMQNMVVN